MTDATSGDPFDPSAPAPDIAGGVAAVILAAGRATRFGGPKVLARVADRPLLAHAIAAARAAGLPAHVVVPTDGTAAEAIAAAVAAAGAVVVPAPDSAAGQRASLRRGLTGLPAGTAAAVVLLGDQPGIDPVVVRALVAAWRDEPTTAWRARYADGPGHPVLLPAALWPAVQAAADADVGARDLLADVGVRELAVAGPAPRDVDRPEDLPGSA